MELYLMYNEVREMLDRPGITVARSLVGNYMTSLDMAGCSVTLLKVDDELLRLWDARSTRRGCAGESDAWPKEVDRRQFERWSGMFARRSHEQRGVPDRARLGDRRRRPRQTWTAA